MKHHNIVFFFLIVTAHMLTAVVHTKSCYSYLYPIDSLKCGGQEYMLSIWQQETDSVELYICDMATGVAQRELFDLFNPVGVKVLPSKAAYSFIDNGRVRIKEFVKRSPQSLVFDKPIFNISLIHWIDDETAYCHAQEGHRFGIYIFDRNGSVQRLLWDEFADYLFPSRVGNKLFYIRRECLKNDTKLYIVCAVPFPEYVEYDEYTLYGAVAQELVLEAGSLPIAFLRMESDELGFVLMHQNEFDPSRDQVLQFHYYALEREGVKWHARQLFSFCVPSFLLNSEDKNRLYENILPLLPHHVGSKIYYGSMRSDTAYESMQIYCFDSARRTKRRCFIAGNRPPFLFAPRVCGEDIVCGGLLTGDAHRFVPEIYVKDNNFVFSFAWLLR